MNEFKAKFTQDFIEDGRWHFITDGLINTIIITILALLMGVIIGVIVSIIRCAHDQKDEKVRNIPLSIANAICKIYIAIIRGTPALVQLLIMYFIVMISAKSKLLVAVLTFGINSGAYVAELFRGGIMSVDSGQLEAGRSLGMSYVLTMRKVVLPQAFKASLPALINEFIALLKETSICGYIGLNELTRGGDIIRGTTYDALLPLLTVALIYFILVMIISYLASLVERRLRRSDKR